MEIPKNDSVFEKLDEDTKNIVLEIVSKFDFNPVLEYFKYKKIEWKDPKGKKITLDKDDMFSIVKEMVSLLMINPEETLRIGASGFEVQKWNNDSIVINYCISQVIINDDLSAVQTDITTNEPKEEKYKDLINKANNKKLTKLKPRNLYYKEEELNGELVYSFYYKHGKEYYDVELDCGHSWWPRTNGTNDVLRMIPDKLNKEAVNLYSSEIPSFELNQYLEKCGVKKMD